MTGAVAEEGRWPSWPPGLPRGGPWPPRRRRAPRWWRPGRLSTWPSSRPIQRSGSRRSSGSLSVRWGTTTSSSRSRSGAKGRLNRTRPRTPVSARRRARCGSEDQNGPSFRATGMSTASSTSTDRRQQGGLDLGRGQDGVGGHDVHVQLERVGAGVGQQAPVAHPAPAADGVEAGDDGDRQRRPSPRPPGPGSGQARCCSRRARGSSRSPRRRPPRPWPACGRPRGPLGRSAPRTGTAARPRRCRPRRGDAVPRDRPWPGWRRRRAGDRQGQSRGSVVVRSVMARPPPTA